MKKFRQFHTDTGPDATLETRMMLGMAPPPEKQYPRFPSTALPQPRRIDAPLGDLLAMRASAKDFQGGDLSLACVSDILHSGAGLNENLKLQDHVPRRHHPSGGGMYPLEYYVASLNVGSLPQRNFHYLPSKHALEEIVVAGEPRAVKDAVLGEAAAFRPAAIVIVTAVWGRSYLKYGDFAYRLALAECGHTMQDMVLAAAARNVRARPVMGFDGKRVAEALDIAHDEEDPLYLLLLGH